MNLIIDYLKRTSSIITDMEKLYINKQRTNNIMGEIYVGRARINYQNGQEHKYARVFLKYAVNINDVTVSEDETGAYYSEFCQTCYKEGLATPADMFLIIIIYGTYIFPIIIAPCIEDANKLCPYKIYNIYKSAASINKNEMLLIYEIGAFSDYINDVDYARIDLMEDLPLRIVPTVLFTCGKN